MLPVLYEFPESMQRSAEWQDPRHWPMVLPNLGKSITLGRLVADWATAQEKGEEEERRWASQHLNVEIGLALHDDRWAGADYWAGAGDKTLTLETLLERSDVAVVGVDGGGLDDLFGLAVIGRERETRNWLVWTHAWADPVVLDRRREIASRLQDFEADGDLTFCDAGTQDISEIADIIQSIAEAGLLPEKGAVGLDPMGISALVDELADRELTEGQMVGIGQGYRLSSAVWGAERKLKDGTLRHSGSNLMAWCVGNVRVEQRGNAVLITKQAAGKAKIDPLMALFDAVMLMNRNPEPKRQPQYQMIFAGGHNAQARPDQPSL
jgi:phage terminase large subunit-like protein